MSTPNLPLHLFSRFITLAVVIIYCVSGTRYAEETIKNNPEKIIMQEISQHNNPEELLVALNNGFEPNNPEKTIKELLPLLNPSNALLQQFPPPEKHDKNGSNVTKT
jgi:cytochrome bd-type quinol oxidase subunit 1